VLLPVAPEDELPRLPLEFAAPLPPLVLDPPTLLPPALLPPALPVPMLEPPALPAVPPVLPAEVARARAGASARATAGAATRLRNSRHRKKCRRGRRDQ